MVRIIGILCGSALAISSLIIALGVPEFLPDPVKMPEIVAEIPVEKFLETVIEVPTDVPLEMADELVADVPSVTQVGPLTEESPATIIETPTPPMPPEEHWYAFWSPFRSELAANGFVSQLQRSTGMDYRVVQLKPGAYEVAFAYEVDADIASHLATISAATGLDMPDG
jgi:hypothetical protein